MFRVVGGEGEWVGQSSRPCLCAKMAAIGQERTNGFGADCIFVRGLVCQYPGRAEDAALVCLQGLGDNPQVSLCVAIRMNAEFLFSRVSLLYYYATVFMLTIRHQMASSCG